MIDQPHLRPHTWAIELFIEGKINSECWNEFILPAIHIYVKNWGQKDEGYYRSKLRYRINDALNITAAASKPKEDMFPGWQTDNDLDWGKKIHDRFECYFTWFKKEYFISIFDGNHRIFHAGDFRTYSAAMNYIDLFIENIDLSHLVPISFEKKK